MSFHAIIDGSTLADALDAIEAVVHECKFRLTPDGLETKAVDPSNVSMVHAEIKSEAFESYEADGGVIGVDLERLQDVVGFASSGDLIELELDEETRKLEIDVEGLSYTLALIDPDSIRQEPDIPDLELPATYVFEGEQLDRAVKAADLCSDHIAVEAVGDAELVFSADGDTDDVVVTLSDRDLKSGVFEGDDGEFGTVESLFSLDYLKDLRKPIGSDTDVSLRVGQEMPFKMQYSMADGGVRVRGMLAPRIESGDAA